MQRHKIARTILLILSVINFALGAPVLQRGIRGVRVDVVDVAKDVPVTIASQKRWNPSDKWWTNSALADRTNTPHNLDSSDSDYRLEQDLRPHDPRSPMDSIASPQPSLPVGSTGPDNSHPLPVDPPPEHDLQSGLNDGPDLDWDHSTNSMPVLPESPSHSYGDSWEYSTSDNLSPSHDSNPPPRHGNLDIFYNRPLWGLPIDGQRSTPTQSDPGRPWPYSPSDSGLPLSDPGDRTTRPHSPPDSGQPTGARSQSGLAPSTGPDPPSDVSDVGPSTPHLPSPGPESENILSELLKGGRFKRRISGSRSTLRIQRLGVVKKSLTSLRPPQYRDVASSPVVQARPRPPPKLKETRVPWSC